MTPIAVTFASAEIAYRQQRVTGDFARANAGRGPRRRWGRRGSVHVPHTGYRAGIARTATAR